jgi:hypothetical protein
MGYANMTLSRWDDIREYDVRDWLFRGQPDEAWPLRTALERYCDRVRRTDLSSNRGTAPA